MTVATHTAPGAALAATVNETLVVLEKFSGVLENETAALRASDFKTLDGLQADKRQCAAKYHELVTSLSSRGEEIKNLDLDLKEKLVKSRTRFTLLLQDNMRALETMKSTTQRLANRILEVARQTVASDQQTNYSSRGKMQSYASSTRSIAIDQSL